MFRLKIQPLIDAVRRSGSGDDGVLAGLPIRRMKRCSTLIPLRGAGKDRPLLGVLLIGNSRRRVCGTEPPHSRFGIPCGRWWNRAGGSAQQLGCRASDASRGELAHAAQDVAAGNWNSSVEVQGHDEVAQLAESFNRMTTELLAQKERLVQTERVAAWRELARRWRMN